MLERTEPPSVENLTEAKRAIEAMLLVANDPTPVQLLAQLVELPADLVQSMCRELAGEYEAERRGFQLVEVAGGWRYQTHPDTHAHVERFALEGIPNRLSSAALETLAIVAYKQPISRAQIGAIRGVNVEGVLRTLVQRGYVDEKGRDDGPGQATLFGTSSFFLEQLGLMSLDDLPPLGDFVPSVEVLEALENTLRVEPEPVPEIVIVDDDAGVEPGPGANGATSTAANGATTNGIEVTGVEVSGVEVTGVEATGASSNGSTAEASPSASANGSVEESVDGEQPAQEATGGELEPLDGDTDDEPVYQVMGDPTDHVVSLDAELGRPSTPNEPRSGLDDEDVPGSRPPLRPPDEPEPVAEADNGPPTEATSDAVGVPGPEGVDEPGPEAVGVPGPEAAMESSDGPRPDELPSDELEVAADPEVDLTDGTTATDAAGVDDARFPGPGSAPPSDDPDRLDPGQGEADDLGRSASSTAERTGRPPGSSDWPQTVIDGLRADAGNGDA